MVWLPYRMMRSSQCHNTARDRPHARRRRPAVSVVDAVAVIDPHDVLFDDRSFIEVLDHIMGRCANQFEMVRWVLLTLSWVISGPVVRGRVLLG